MKSTLSKVGVAMLVVAFMLPLCAEAQYGPPEGFDMSSIPAGYTMPTGMPSGDQMGPPADLQEKLAKGLARLKKGAISMARAVKAMEKAVAGAEKVGYVTPQAIKDSIAKANAAIQTINNATSLEDDSTQQAIDDFDAFTEVLDANIENLALIPRFQKVIKSADVQYDKLVRFFESTKKRLEGLEADTTQAIADVGAKVEAQKTYRDQARELSLQGKMEEAFAMLEENFFPGLETTSQSIGALNALKAVTKTATGVARGIKTAERIIAKLKLAKLDTTGLEKVVADSKAKLEELKTVLKTPNYELDSVMALLETLDGMREDFDNKVEAMVGEMDIKLPEVKMFTGTKIMVPSAMRNDFDTFKDKMGGYKGLGQPSDMYEIDLNSFVPEGIPEGYGF